LSLNVPSWNLYCHPPDDYVDRQLGMRVRLLREARGMTQQALADQLGLSGHSWVSKVEAGALSVTPGRLRALSLALGCCPTVLLSL